MSSTRTNDVPWDVVTDILSRLPVKSLIRFRSVAKSFYALSKDPEFISRHLHRSSNNGSRLLVDTNFAIDSCHSFSLLSLKTFDFAVEPRFPSPKSNGMVAVVGSCNGIVCLLCEQGPFIILWNPSIREHIILSAPLLPDSFLATGTSFSSFGFDFHNGEYKIVRIVADSNYEVDLPKIEIYSTCSGLWRESNSNLLLKIYDLTCSVVIEGTPYWREYESDDPQKSIVLFDTISEVFERIILPWWSKDISWETLGVGTVNDHLAVYFQFSKDYYVDEDDDRSIEIWAMNYQNSIEKWTKLFVIRNFAVPGRPLGLYDDGLFLWIKLDRSRFFPSTSGDLLIYSPHTTKEGKSIKCFKDLEFFEVHAHLESLVWIDAGNKHS